MKFRYGTSNDVDWLVEQLSLSMYKLYGATDLYDEEYLKTMFVPHILSDGVCIVAEKENRPIGCIAGKITPFIYNPNKIILAELVWWVADEHRNSSAGLRLLKYFELYGIEKGVDKITLSTMPSTELSENAMLKRGYVLKEYCFIKGVK